MSAFRKEAVNNHAHRLHGEILALPRLSHFLISLAVFFWIFLLIIWLCTSSYSRKEQVRGWTEPESGVIRIYAGRAGIVKSILVSNGDAVKENQPLVIIESSQQLPGGGELEIIRQEEYERQKKMLEEQLGRNDAISIQRSKNIAHKIVSTKAEIELIQQQIAMAAKRHIMITGQLSRFRKLNKKGHASSSMVEEVVEKDLSIRSELQALELAQLSKKSHLEQLVMEQIILPEEKANTEYQLRAQLSETSHKIILSKAENAYIIKSSVSGTVDNLHLREGEQLSGNKEKPVLSISPEESFPIVNLLVPSRSFGFVEIGQTIDVRFDAYPYQRFGLYRGTITRASGSITLPGELHNSPVPIDEPAYVVSAKLERPFVSAYGKQLPLKPGMTLSADVQLYEGSLLDWLLDPIYSLKGRM